MFTFLVPQIKAQNLSEVRSASVLSWLKWESRTVENLHLSFTVLISIYFFRSKSEVSLPYKSA
jgi:hypothetical protein